MWAGCVAIIPALSSTLVSHSSMMYSQSSPQLLSSADKMLELKDVWHWVIFYSNGLCSLAGGLYNLKKKKFRTLHRQMVLPLNWQHCTPSDDVSAFIFVLKVLYYTLFIILKDTLPVAPRIRIMFMMLEINVVCLEGYIEMNSTALDPYRPTKLTQMLQTVLIGRISSVRGAKKDQTQLGWVYWN